MIAYTGIETISNLSEEARDPSRDIPRLDPHGGDRRLRHLLHAAGHRALGAAGDAGPRRLHDAPRAAAGGRRLRQRPGARAGGQPGRRGPPARRRSRSTWACWPRPSSSSPPTPGSSARRASPTRWPATASCRSRFRRLHPRFKTPWLALVLFAGVAAIIAMLPGQTDFLGTIYSFGAMLSFTIAHVSLVALRVRKRDEELVYRARPNLRFRGIDWPLFAILGGLGTGPGLARRGRAGAAHPLGRARRGWCSASSSTSSTAGGCSRSAAARDRARARAGARAGAADRVPLDRRAGHALGGVGGGPGHRRAPGGRAPLAGGDRPRARDPDGAAAHGRACPRPSARPTTLLDDARALVESYGVRAVTRLERARSAGAAIVADAVARDAELVVIGAPRRGIGRARAGLRLARPATC